MADNHEKQDPQPFISRRFVAGALAIAALVLVAYIPAINAGFIWDDDYLLTENPLVTEPDGFSRAWLEPGSRSQYYPLVYSSFILEHSLWGMDPMGYHIVNVCLHIISALLLWRVLALLGVPGAWLAAALFAVHPVCVESVAWVSERKNALSTVFYLLSGFCLLRFFQVGGPAARRVRWGLYTAGFAFFMLALFSKTVTSTLPAALLVVLWYKNGRLSWRQVFSLLPLFVAGVALGLVTVWMEKNFVGAAGREWSLTLVERLLLAGRILWFYAGKLVFPVNLCFNYPRWVVDQQVWWQYLYPLAALLTLAISWAGRKRVGRGPLAAALFFGGTLFPALGFFDVYPFRYSFVADHFQYLASMGLLTLFASLIHQGLLRMAPHSPVGRGAPVALLLAGLAALTWVHCTAFTDLRTLWTRTLVVHPQSFQAHNDLGTLALRRGEIKRAETHYLKALENGSGISENHMNLAKVYNKQEKYDQALEQALIAMEKEPRFGGAYMEAAEAMYQTGRFEEAARFCRQALGKLKDNSDAFARLARAEENLGRKQQALENYARALKVNPDNAFAHNNLGLLLVTQGFQAEGQKHLERARQLEPSDPSVYNNLGVAALRSRDYPKAVEAFGRALEMAPEYWKARGNLALALASSGKPDQAAPVMEKLVNQRPADALARYNYARMLLQSGKNQQAVEQLRAAIEVNPDFVQAKKLLERVESAHQQ